MTPRDTEFKVCSECKVKVSLAYGNIDGRYWFCVDCLVKSPLRADVGLLDFYYRYSTPYYGFPQLTKEIRHKMRLDPRQFKVKKESRRGKDDTRTTK